MMDDKSSPKSEDGKYVSVLNLNLCSPYIQHLFAFSTANEILSSSSRESDASVEVDLGESSNAGCEVTTEIEKLSLSRDAPSPATSTPGSPQSLVLDGGSEQLLGSISEAGRFSLAAICALSLHDLFGYRWDEEFSVRSIRYITVNLQLPEKVSPAFCKQLYRCVSKVHKL